MAAKHGATINNAAKGRRSGKIPEWRVEDFRTIVTMNADPMIVLDGAGYVLYVNPAAEHLFNLPGDEMAGLNFGFPIMLNEPVEVNILREFKDFIAAEMRMVEVVWAGEPSYLISFRDLTDRIIAEQVMRQSREELEVIVKERTDELSITNQSLKTEIMERKLAEEKLRESYRFTSAYLGNLPGIIYRRRNDTDCTMEFLSPGTKKITGFDVSDLFYNRKVSYGQLIHPEDRERVRNEMQAAISDKKSFDISYRIITARGEEKWVWDQGRIGFKNGKVILEGYISDITDRKVAEEALTKSQTLLRMITDGTPDPVYIKDRQSRIMLCNPALLRIYGRPFEDVVGKTDQELYPDPAIGEAIVANDRMVLESGMSKAIEELAQTPDGIRTFLSTKTPYRNSNGEVIGIFGISRDITERKRSEDELCEAKEYAENLIETANVMVLGLDVEGKVNVFNKAAEEITGYSRAEMMGQSWELVLPKDRYEYAWKEFDRLAEGALPMNFENPVLTKSGEERYISWQNNEVLEHGRIVGSISFGMDITERKRAEEALKGAKQQAELYVDLMSHDIRNMNHAAMGYLELALQALETEKRLKLDDKVLIERPMRALENSSALIDNVRKLQMLMTEGVKTKPTDLHKIFKDLEATSFHLEERDVRINIQQVPDIMVDANELLKDVFFNLTTNAIRHSDMEKPLTVNVKVEPVNENGQKYYKCIVEDDGPGIPDALKGKLFHRFKRGATKAHGKGLGLYLVRTLVEGYHGKVWVEDRVPGDHTKGAKFVVMLPAMDNSSSRAIGYISVT